jgi:hypothetical protein
MKKLIDLADPFFAPAWIRIAVVTVMLIWGIFEFVTGEVIWGTLFTGVGAVCAWRFATIDYSTEPKD